jgi:DNA-binding transcriptional LysR family regulator
LRSIVDGVCASRGIALSPALELDSLDLVKSMMLDDISTRYTILPYHSVQREIASDVLGWAEISDPAMARTVALVVPEASRNADAVECIGARVRDRVRELKAKLPTIL